MWKWSNSYKAAILWPVPIFNPVHGSYTTEVVKVIWYPKSAYWLMDNKLVLNLNTCKIWSILRWGKLVVPIPCRGVVEALAMWDYQ